MKNNIYLLSFFLSLGIFLQAQSTICLGDSRNYSVDDADGTTGTAGSTYTWAINTAGFVGTITSPNVGDTNDVDVDWGGTPTGTYTLEVIENTASGCPGTTITHDIEVIELPTAPTLVADIASVCSGDDGSFTLTGLPNATVTYSINGGADATIVLNSTGTATVFAPGITSDTTLTLTSITNGSCDLAVNVSATITVAAAPVTSPIMAN